MKNTHILIPLVLFVTILLTGCAPAAPARPTPDVAIAQTNAVGTVYAQFTLTAASWTPTLLPPPSETPTLTITDTPVPSAAPTQIGNPGATQFTLCDKYAWNDGTVDVNIPDGSEMTAGQEFVKTWRIKNTGTCTWGEGYKVIYAGYTDKMSGQPQPLPGVVAPGQEVEISVQFKAPAKAGDYISAWTLTSPRGINFFGNNNKPVFVKIIVK